MFRRDDWTLRADALRRMARALVQDAHQSEDLAQAACLMALQRPPKTLSTAWLKVVLRSRALDARRRRERAREQSLEAEHERRAPAADQIAQKLELHRAVVEAVRSLDEPYRRVVYLRYFDDLGPEEIARELGAPVKTIKTRLARALPLLRSRLEPDFGGRHGLVALLGAELARSTPASPAAPVAPLASNAAVFGGILIMIKKVALVVVLGVAVWGALRLRAVEPAAAHPETVERTAVVDEVEATPEISEPAPADERATARRGLTESAPAADEAQPATRTGSLAIEVRFHDGRPAQNVVVDLRTNEQGRPYAGYARFETDSSGLTLAADLAPGIFEVVCRGGRQSTEVVAGEERSLTFELERGVDVEGRVVDAAGQSVSGAAVWLTSGTTDWQGSSCVARSDENGGFTIRSVPPDQSIGAAASGRAPSPLVDLDDLDTSQDLVQVELTLPELGTGCELSGRVLRPDGTPAANAWVTAGTTPKYFRQRNEGYVESWTSRLARTDDQGQFELAGLAAGAQPINVQARGFPIWKGETSLAPGFNSFDVRLFESARVVGVVRDEGGEPVSGAVLRGFDSEVDEMFLQMGQFDFFSTFGYPSAVTDEAGRFVLTELPPGPAHLFASPPPDPSPGLGSRMRAQTVLQLTAGQEARWDPLLGEGLVLAGVVQFDEGTPLPGVFIRARNEENGKVQSLYAGESGTFRFLNLEPVPYTLTAQAWDPPRGADPIVQEHVMPGGHEVRLVAGWSPRPLLPGATVIGRFDDAGNRLQHEGALGFHLAAESGIFNTDADFEDGEFRFEDVETGTYQLIVFSGENPILWTDWFEVPPGDVHDLGTLRTESGGALRFRVERAPGTELSEFQLWLSRDGAPRAASVGFGSENERLVEGLTLGEYSIQAWGNRMVPIQKLQATVTLDEVPTVTLKVEPAAVQPIEVWLSEDASASELNVQVLAADGEQFTSFRVRDPRRLERPMVRSVLVPAGRYTVLAETAAGPSGEARFEIDDLEAQYDPVRVEVR